MSGIFPEERYFSAGIPMDGRVSPERISGENSINPQLLPQRNFSAARHISLWGTAGVSGIGEK